MTPRPVEPPRWTPPEESTSGAVDREEPVGGRGPWQKMGIGALWVGAVVAAGALVLQVPGTSDDPSAAPATSASALARTPTAAEAAALSWAEANGRPGALIFVPPGLEPTKPGFEDSVLPYDVTFGEPDLLLVNSTLGDARYSRAAEFAASSVPIAVFGSGGERTEVRARLDGNAEAIAADLSARKLAGEALADNPNLRWDAESRAALRAGTVDPRALVALAWLSEGRTLDVSLPLVAAAGGEELRHRTLAISSVDRRPVDSSRSARQLVEPLVDVLVAQPDDIRPRVVGPDDDGLRVTYPAPEPVGLLDNSGLATTTPSPS